jgi:hypothetical protein
MLISSILSVHSLVDGNNIITHRDTFGMTSFVILHNTLGLQLCRINISSVLHPNGLKHPYGGKVPIFVGWHLGLGVSVPHHRGHMQWRPHLLPRS